MARILVIGATGYIGRYIVRASVAAGLSTCALLRPSAAIDPRKVKLLDEFTASGVQLVYGSLQDQESLKAALKEVDIVISAVGVPQILDQLLLVRAIKEVGTVKRFLPSEFGQDVDKVTCLKPCQEAMIHPKVRVRRATELAGIPHTYVVTNGFAKFHFNMEERNGELALPQKVVIYGDGNAKASFVVEEDIGLYTIRAALDDRALNKTLHIRPPANALSRKQTIEVLENVTGKSLQKTYMSEVEILQRIQDAAGSFEAVILSLMYSAHIKGDTFRFELGPSDVQAHELYPDYKCTDAYAYLHRFCRSD